MSRFEWYNQQRQQELICCLYVRSLSGNNLSANRNFPREPTARSCADHITLNGVLNPIATEAFNNYFHVLIIIIFRYCLQEARVKLSVPSLLKNQMEKIYLSGYIMTIDGIILSDLEGMQTSRDEFVLSTKSALDLLAKHDPHRYKRVISQLRFIVNKRLPCPACYSPMCSCCFIDLEQLRFRENKRHFLIAFAATLVHEATHGLIDRRGVPYNKRFRERIEQTCIREETKTVNNIAPELESLMIGDPDARAKYKIPLFGK